MFLLYHILYTIALWMTKIGAIQFICLWLVLIGIEHSIGTMIKDWPYKLIMSFLVAYLAQRISGSYIDSFRGFVDMLLLGVLLYPPFIGSKTASLYYSGFTCLFIVAFIYHL